MRLVVAGSRSVRDARLVAGVIAEAAAALGAPTTILHGGSPGADALADAWARAHGVPVRAFPPADESTAAKHARNARLVARGDALAVVWDRATQDTTPDVVARARAAGLPVFARVV